MYPENLTAKSGMWLWSLRDFSVLAVALLISVLALAELHLLLPAAATMCFGFMTVRIGDSTILDYINHAVRFFISVQQYYEWRL